MSSPPKNSLDAVAAAARKEEVDRAAKASMLAGFDRKTAAPDAPVAAFQTEQPRTLGPLVTLRELADELGMDRSACRRYVLRLGYKPSKQRTADSGFQAALTFTRQEADEIRAKRSAEGY